MNPFELFVREQKKVRNKNEERIEGVVKKIAVVLNEEKVNVVEMMDILVNMQIRLSLKLKEWNNEPPAEK